MLALPALAAAAYERNIIEAAQAENESTGRLDSLMSVLSSQEQLRKTLEGRGQFTLFAPTDAAFEELFALDACGAIELNEHLMNTMLNYHIVRGVRTAGREQEPMVARSRLGAPVAIGGDAVEDTGGTVANYERFNLPASNGVVHVIDRILWPFPAPSCS